MDRKLLIGLNLIGLALFFLFGWLFTRLASRLVLTRQSLDIHVSGFSYVLAILAATITILLLHEMTHGLFFWLVTKSRPRFGLRAAYAYAAAPEWYVSRNAYAMIGLAPLIVLTALGIAIIPYVDINWLYVLIFAMTINASGSVGDAYVVGWLLLHPANTLVNDHGDAIWFYQAGPE